MRNWPIYYELLKTASVPGSSYVASHFAVAVLPFPSVLGGQDLAISAGSRHPTAALQIIKYLTSPQAEQCLFAVGGFPATRGSAYATGAALPAGYGGIAHHPLCGSRPGLSPQIGQFIQVGIADSFQRPRTPYYTEFTDIVQDQATQALNGTDGIDLADPMSALVSELRAAASGLAPAP
jgi:multiple sugar transport system substrate-binding protein